MPDPTQTFQVCDTCHGHGKVVHPSLSVWTQSDRDEDPEGFESMMEGDYDVPCPECKGLRVTSTTDHEDYLERERDRRTQLMESGIYPGSRDWY